MKAYAPVSALALNAFGELEAGGVPSTTRAADPFRACFGRSQDSTTPVEELRQAQVAGHDVEFEILDGEEARRLEPTLSTATSMAVGPVTGRLLAAQVVTGVAPAALAPFDPLR